MRYQISVSPLVFSDSHRLEMIRIYAQYVVALMVYLKSIWNWTYECSIRKPVTINALTVNPKLGIFTVGTANPYPAT
jgi:hypothetical protein